MLSHSSRCNSLGVDGDQHAVGCLQGRGASGIDTKANSQGECDSGEVQNYWRPCCA